MGCPKEWNCDRALELEATESNDLRKEYHAHGQRSWVTAAQQVGMEFTMHSYDERVVLESSPIQQGKCFREGQLRWEINKASEFPKKTTVVGN